MGFQSDVEKIFQANRRVTDTYQYTVPSPTAYPYQWLWDSCFHAIILSYFDLQSAKKEIRSLLARQFDNGMIPHIIYWEEGDVINFDWGTEGTSSITQPPMLAYAVRRIFECDGDEKFLEEVYRNLFHFYKYLINERDPHERNLIGIINPDESGEDDSPRFDHLLNLPPVHSLEENLEKRLALVKENKKCNFDAPFCMKNFFWVKDVPFNSIMVENLAALAHIADKLGRAYDANYFNRAREEIIESMRKLMFQDGIFWSTFGEDYRSIKVKTWAIFAPLFGEICEKEDARRLVEEHLLNEKEFWTTYPIPTVSLDEPSFNPHGFWRGPTWFASNWFVYHGLRKYGFNDIAKELAQKSLALIEKSGFRENFNPHNGTGLGAKQFTWGGLILDMGIEK